MRRARSLALIILSVAWVAVVAAAPLSALGVPLSAGVYAFGSRICHQRPERSFYLAGAQLPVCARCLGLYTGTAIGAIATLAALKRRATVTTPLAERKGRATVTGPLAARNRRATVTRPLAALKRHASGRRATLRPMWRSASALRRWRMLLIVATLPTAVTWAVEAIGLASLSNTSRFIAALPLGVAVAVTVNYIECARPPRIESRPPPTPI